MFIIHKNTVMSIGYTLNGSANPGRAFPYFALTHTHIHTLKYIKEAQKKGRKKIRP